MPKKPKTTRETLMTIVPVERIERQIYLIRGQKVMLDSDLAGLYQVPTKALNQG
jgi:ORF6N domain